MTDRDERIAEIRERQQRRRDTLRGKGDAAVAALPVMRDVGDLLSIIDALTAENERLRRINAEGITEDEVDEAAAAERHAQISALHGR